MAEIKDRPEMNKGVLTTEEWREYEFTPPGAAAPTVYRVNNPVAVYFYKGCTTHRVEDVDGIVHCVPAIGQLGCVLRWKTKPGFPVAAW